MGNVLSEYLKNFLKNDYYDNKCTVKRSDSAEHLIFEDTFGKRMTKICLLNCSCKSKYERNIEEESNKDTKFVSKLNEEVSCLRKELAETKSLIQSLEGLIKDLSSKVEVSLNQPAVQQGVPPPPPPPPLPPLAGQTMAAFTVPITPVKSAKKATQNPNKSMCRMIVTLEDLQNVKLKKTPLPSKRSQDNEKKEDNFLLRPSKRKKLDI